jgi:oligopeptide/dipeptide ABC transporter ATP-binding protein
MIIAEPSKPTDTGEPILRVDGLTTQFFTKRRPVIAADGVSFDLHARETLAIVGESGSGKSVTALSVLGLIPPAQGRVTAGRILFGGRDLVHAEEKEMTGIRGNRISMIFQEPMTSLNPILTAGFQIMEVLKKHRRMRTRLARQEAVRILTQVGIPEPESRLTAYPHQLSGGMLQRVMIAMALSCHPEILIADEPTTALDVTIQAQILGLIRRLKNEIGMAVILITHDLGVVAQNADTVLVMYAGKIMEAAPVAELFARPMNPYTLGLFESIPKVGTGNRRLVPIPGAVPGLDDLPPGCPFQDRCPHTMAVCQVEPPPWVPVGERHFSRCWLHGD